MVRGLIVSQFPLFPTTQGNRLRLLSVCQEFRRAGFALDFLYYPRDNGALFTVAELEDLHAFFNLVFLLPSNDPWPTLEKKYQTAGDIWHPKIGAFFQFLSPNIKYDFVYANYAPYSHIFSVCDPEVLRILDTHDRLGDRRDFMEMQGLRPDFFCLSVPEEGSLSSRADIVLAIKEAEAGYYRGISGKPVLTLSVRADEPPSRPAVGAQPEGRPVTFGFIGSNNAVNRRAMAGLFDLMLPRVARWTGRARLLVLGRVIDGIDVPDALAGLVESVRFLPDLADFYDRCDVVMVPTIFSTGLKIKSVEALSFHKPVVSTADGFDGVDSPYPEHNCPSQVELMETCDRIVDGALGLDVLARMTEDVLDLYRGAYEAHSATLIRALDKHRVVVSVPPGAATDLLYVHLFGLLRFLARRCTVALHCARPELLSPTFVELLNRIGGSARHVTDPADAACDILIQGDAPSVAIPSARVVVSCTPRGLRLSGPAVAASAMAKDGAIDFPDTRPVDLIDEPYWGPRERLILFVSRLGLAEAPGWITSFAASEPFRLIRAEFDECRIVTTGDADALAACARANGFGFARLRDHLFDAPWEHRKNLVFVGPFDFRELPFCAALMSLRATRLFVQDDTMMTLGKSVCGADVAVPRFANIEHLGELLGRALSRPQTKHGSLMRYRPAGGAVLRVVETLKRVLVEDVLGKPAEGIRAEGTIVPDLAARAEAAD